MNEKTNRSEIEAMTASKIHPADRTAEGEVNGRWVIECQAWDGMYPAGTLVCDPVFGEAAADDLSFTAANGKRYSDMPQGCQFTPRV